MRLINFQAGVLSGLEKNFGKKHLWGMDIVCIKAVMKMTLNIDDGLLERVMGVTGARTKTEAIDLALREMDRRSQLIEVLSRDHGLTSAQWRDAFEPDYDVESLRVAETSPPATDARKPRPRR